MTAEFRCERCDTPLHTVEVTTYGDTERRYLPGITP